MKHLFISLTAFSLLVLNSCKKDVPGCRSNTAVNYNAEATTDDGTCIYKGAISVSPEINAGLEEAEIKIIALDGSYADYKTIKAYQGAAFFNNLIPKTYRIVIEATYYKNVWVNGSNIKEYSYVDEEIQYTLKSSEHKVIYFEK